MKVDSLKIVDAHQHFWDLEHNYYPWLCDEPPIPFRYGDYSAIRKTYLPHDYVRDTAGHQVVKTVHVEAEWNPADPIGETRWLQQIVSQYGLPSAVIASARLDQQNVEQVLAAHAAFPIVRGIRHKPRAAAHPDTIEAGAPGSLSDPNWRAGFALLARHGFSFDLQTPYWHLYEAAELASEFPDTQIILNHTGLPSDRSRKGLAAWHQAMKAVAKQPNVAVKISGLGRRGQPWSIAENGQIVLDTIETFGVDRCMFASNFPVDKIVADFDTIFTTFKKILGDFPTTDHEYLFHNNAVRIYRL
jgi:predicted TIM-barrel fold metal-dependent hydrolase